MPLSNYSREKTWNASDRSSAHVSLTSQLDIEAMHTATDLNQKPSHVQERRIHQTVSKRMSAEFQMHSPGGS
eukprot:12899862-Prorocentrum_lima.AAC.1